MKTIQQVIAEVREKKDTAEAVVHNESSTSDEIIKAIGVLNECQIELDKLMLALLVIRKYSKEEA